MGYLSLPTLLLVLIAPEMASARDRAPIVELLERLQASSTAGTVLEHARQSFGFSQVQGLEKVIVLGEESRTDAVVVRKFDPVTGRESRHREVEVHLNIKQPLEGVVLDLIHELVHAATRPGFDPYDPELTPGRYISHSIEGQGGEVEAVVAECAAAWELYPGSAVTEERCGDYPKNSDMRLSVAQDFYKAGLDAERVKQRLLPGENLPLLSQARPKLFSSTGKTSYPVALMREYDELTKIACENSRRRLASVKGSSAEGQVMVFIERRCS